MSIDTDSSPSDNAASLLATDKESSNRSSDEYYEPEDHSDNEDTESAGPAPSSSAYNQH